MSRRLRVLIAFVAFLAIATVPGQTFWPSPASAAIEEAVPCPSGGEEDGGTGDEGGDADEVLIQTNPNRPFGSGTLRPEAAAAEAPSLWAQVLRLLGFTS